MVKTTWPRVHVNVEHETDPRTAAVSVEFRGPNDGLLANVILSPAGVKSLRDQVTKACLMLERRKHKD
jgi:hypothetical protein